MRKEASPEQVVQEIRRKTRRRFSAEEKIRIVLEGLWPGRAQKRASGRLQERRSRLEEGTASPQSGLKRPALMLWKCRSCGNQNAGSHRTLEISPRARDSHMPTAFHSHVVSRCVTDVLIRPVTDVLIANTLGRPHSFAPSRRRRSAVVSRSASAVSARRDASARGVCSRSFFTSSLAPRSTRY